MTMCSEDGEMNMNQVKELRNENAINKDDMTVLIDGSRAKTSELFLGQIFALLNFPEKKYKNWAMSLR